MSINVNILKIIEFYFKGMNFMVCEFDLSEVVEEQQFNLPIFKLPVKFTLTASTFFLTKIISSSNSDSPNSFCYSKWIP